MEQDPDPDPCTYTIGDNSAIRPGMPNDILRGKIENFKAMTRVWRYVIITTLGIDPSDCSMIITEPAQNDEAQRRQMVEIMFNEFNFRSILVASAPVLAFYSRHGNGANANGIVVEIGDSVTQVVSIYAGRCMERAAIRINEIGGCDVTDKLVGDRAYYEEICHLDKREPLLCG